MAPVYVLWAALVCARHVLMTPGVAALLACAAILALIQVSFVVERRLEKRRRARETIVFKKWCGDAEDHEYLRNALAWSAHIRRTDPSYWRASPPIIPAPAPAER